MYLTGYLQISDYWDTFIGLPDFFYRHVVDLAAGLHGNRQNK